MTTVADESISGGGVKKKKGWGAPGRKKSGGKKNAWNLLWQVPLLAAGLVAFGYGVRAMTHTIKPVPFEEQVAAIKSHIAAGKYDQAIKEINAQANFYSKRDQLGQLEVLSGDATYLAQRQQPAYVRENYEHVNEYYKNALAFGITPTPEINERWGETALALGDGRLAMEKLEAAIAADPSLLSSHVRELAAAYLAVGNFTKAAVIIDQLLASKGLGPDDRSWALCKKIELAMKTGGIGGELEKAVGMARKSLADIPERDPAGRVLVWIGRAELQQGQMDAAKKDLTTARERFVSHDVDDGRAAILLGRIAQVQGDLTGAAELYQNVVIGQAGTTVWAAGRFGRAEVAASTDQTPDQMAADYRYVIQMIRTAQAAPRLDAADTSTPEMISPEQIRDSLLSAYRRHFDANKLEAALIFLDLQAEMKDRETAASVYRWAITRERRSAEVLEDAQAAPAGTEKLEKETAGIDMLRQSADDYVQHAKLSTMDDAISANSIWHAAQLFDRAGEPARSLALFEKFTIQWPRDPRVPEGLLTMGLLNQSLGKLDAAIVLYERDRAENPRTPAAYTSAINVARCYMLKGTPPVENFTKAENALLSLVQDNPDLRPTATEFRDSIFMLGELYYQNGRWADAILRLEEGMERYPDDTSMPRAMFMLADSYRKSAGEIAAALAKDPGLEGRGELANARKDRLEKAAGLFGRVVEALDTDPDRALAGTEPNLTPLQENYLRTSYMQRGECYFELGDYATAIKMYDQAATRFSQHVIAIEAYVQMVNCYLTLKDPLQAAAAAERGQWALKRIPDEEFGKGSLALNRQYYEDLLRLGKK